MNTCIYDIENQVIEKYNPVLVSNELISLLNLMSSTRKLKKCVGILLIAFFSLNSFIVHAQSKKDLNPNSKERSIGFKSSTIAGKSTQEKTKTHLSVKPTIPLDLSTERNDIEPLEAKFPQVDFNQLPAELRQKVSENKKLGHPAFEGIVKAYSIALKQCNNKYECTSKLAFLSENQNVIAVKNPENNVFNIVVELQMQSEDLKALLLVNGLTFNFLNEYFLLRDQK